MALFSRRTIQSMVDEISDIITRNQLKNLVNRLNLPSSQAVDAEYELAVLLSLSKLGSISHEPDLGGSSRADVLFRVTDGESDEFVADITCISQQGLSDRQPLHFLETEFGRLIESHGIKFRGFHFQIAHSEDGSFYDDDRKVTLKIPGNNEITRIFMAEIPAIAQTILQARNEKHKFPICKAGLEVEITYDPDGIFLGGGHRVVDVPLSLEHNPVFQRLENKSEQLEKTGYSGIRGVFLCDSGSRIVQGKFHPEPYSLENILEFFFKKHREISFVCMLYSAQYQKQQSERSERQRSYRITGDFFTNPSAVQPISDKLKDLIRNLPHNLPNAESDGRNAQNWIAAYPKPYGRSFIGGLEMTGHSVKLSARALQELLAGHLDQEEFMKVHGFVPNEFEQVAHNPFEKELAMGRLITHVEVSSAPGADDDWVIFHFGESDPAISIIRMPTR